ncbi:Ig-like domain-containing protein [Methanococcus voltae]|uniref:Ig-like domain-containing protein n=1 Tax=Methanococcus voltae TaxID=2188 RepID=UPI001AE77AE5|nr:Ig-like domain-containing protein [Methanococcus voltae]MBP2173212.1 parallel beta-helix repeat protein [Methanococcus voltae]
MNKNYKITFFMLLMVTMLAVNTVYADTAINGPYTINTPGKYYLTNNISHDTGDIIKITSNDVILDGKGFTIDGQESADRAILVYKVSTEYKNITIKNFNIQNCTAEGIYLYRCNDSIIFNNTAQDCAIGIRVQGVNNTVLNNTMYDNWNGMVLWYVNDSILKYNEIYDSSGVGLYTLQAINCSIFNNNIYSNNNQNGVYLESSTNNILYNNIFNNSNNLDTYMGLNYLNTTKENGGGNYWFTPTGTGWSEYNSTDNNGDGFCDNPYVVKADLVDYLPKCIDTTGPIMTIVSPANKSIFTKNYIIVNITAVDASGIDKIESEFYGYNHTMTEYPTYYSIGYGSLLDGNYSLKFYAFDNLSHRSVKKLWFVINTKAPEITINTPINNKVYNTSDIFINATATDAIGIKEVMANINGTNITMNINNSYYTLSKNLADDKYSLKVYAEDNVGNKSVTDEITFSVDTTAPTFTVHSPANKSIFNKNSFKVNVTAVDKHGIDKIVSELDGSNTTLSDHTKYYNTTYDNVLDKNYSLKLYTFDNMGNRAVKKLWVVIDTKAPNVTLNTPISNKIYNTSDIFINATVNDTNGIKEVMANINGTNTTMNINNSYYTVSKNLADDKYSLKVYAEDNVGNKNVTDEITFSVDTTAPEIITVKPTAGSTVGIATNVQVTVNEKSTVNISITKGTNKLKYDLIKDPNNENLHSKLISNLEAGTYTLKVTATDLYKNSYTNEYTFIVDETKPVMEIARPTNNSIFNETIIPINATVTDTYGIKEVLANIKSTIVDKNITLLKDGNNYLGNTDALTEGNYNITIHATNNLGNINNTQPNEVIVDLTKPVITNENPNRTVVNAGFTINATVTDNVEVKNVTVQLNGENISLRNVSGNIYSTSAINSLSSGNYTYIITAYDTARNYVKTKVINFTLDSTAPKVTLNSPIGLQNKANITINATVTDSTGIKSVMAELNGENNTLTLTDGYYIVNKTLMDNNYALKIYAIDNVDNKAVTPVSVFKVDTKAPYITINSPNGTLKTDKFLINVSSYEGLVTSGIKEVIANINNENITLTKTGDYYLAEKTLNDGTYLLNVTSIDNANNSNSTSTTFTIDTYVPSSSNNNRRRTIDASDSIESKSLRRTVSDSTVVYGSNFDKQLANNLKENTYSDDTEIDGDTIILGGPVSNRIANQYNDRFSIPVTNDNPGTNRGIIQVISIPSGSSSIVQSYKLIYIAGSDRLGTEAALKYFETLTELPDEPITVEWVDGGFKVIE